jgi:predicted aspartyl protease
MKLKHILKRKGYYSIKLKKTITNHYEVKAKINSIKGRFILDTGASNSCMDFSDAKAYKLDVQDSDTKAAGAGATDMQTQQSTHNTLQIGAWKINNFHLVLFDLSHVNAALTNHNAKAVQGIIGADILQKGKAIIDYKKNRLYLKRMVFKY